MRARDFLEAERLDAIERSTEFVVNWFLGGGRWDHSHAASVEEARRLRDERGLDEYGRRGAIYAVLGGKTIHVE